MHANAVALNHKGNYESTIAKITQRNTQNNFFFFPIFKRFFPLWFYTLQA